MFQTKNDMQEKTRIQLISILQTLLASSIDLTTQAKHAHWNVKGPDFISLHELFDKIAEESEEYSDLIAERLVQFGGVANGTARMIAAKTELPDYPLDLKTGRNHVAALSHVLATYSELLQQAIPKVDEFKDTATVDIFTEIVRSVDKNLWFVEAHNQAER